MYEVQIIELNENNISKHALCTLKNPKHEGYQQKVSWLKSRFKEGLRLKVLHSEKDGDVGMIEYVPGKYAWRTVNAAKYMFIHCIFIAKKDYQNRGYGKMLIEDCINEAKKSKMHGVATITSKSAFLAEKDLFIKNGFELIDTAAPAYELMVLKFGKYKNPSFPADINDSLKKYQKGLTILISKQCPFIAKAIKEIGQTAIQNGIKPKIIEVRNYKEAQAAPVGYGCFGMIWNGEIVADHPISNGRFKNIMKKVILPTL